jgi:hypothetical protein
MCEGWQENSPWETWTANRPLERAGMNASRPVIYARETIIREGDDTARDAATIGVLEDIQTIASNRPFGAAAFEGWLGPLSRQAWEEIDRLWRAGGGSLAGVIRLESRLRSKGARPWWRFWNRDSV